MLYKKTICRNGEVIGMKNYDVIIIGAGPSGIFCAYELIHQRPDMKILMIEKGRPLENRVCPKRKT